MTGKMSVHMRCQVERTLGLLHLQAGTCPVLVLAMEGMRDGCVVSGTC